MGVCKVKKNLAWTCECGAEFEATGKGSTELMQHIATGKETGCKWIGLVDKSTGEVLARRARDAVARGLIRKSVSKKLPAAKTAPEARSTSQGKFTPGSPIRGSMKFQHVELPPALWVLFELARLKWPGEYPDNEAGFVKWLTECVFVFYEEHARELGFDQLMRATLRPQ